MNDLLFTATFQFLGIIALILCVVRYLYNDIVIMLRTHSASNYLFALQMLLIGNIAGAILCSIAGTRSCLLSTPLSKHYKSHIILILLPITLCLGLYFSRNLLDVIVTLGVLPLVYAEFKACEAQYRRINVFLAVPWIIYGAHVASLGLFLASVFAFLSCAYAILKFDYTHIYLKLISHFKMLSINFKS